MYQAALHFIRRRLCPLLLAILAIPGVPAQASASVTVDQLRCEYLVDPIGIDEVKPRLSWVVGSLRRGEKQTAWQVLVASTPEVLAAGQGDLWDSGKTTGDATNQIVYDGSVLPSRAECHWKVRSWDKNDQPSSWSAPAKWSIGLLQASDWSAKWIDGSNFGSAPAGGDPPVILGAFYEAAGGGGSLDVTAMLNALAAQGDFLLGVTNETFGSDPAFGQLKRLRIQYQRGGQMATKTFPEDSVVSVPADLPPVASPVITSARYESVSGTGFRDVAATLVSAAQAGSFSLPVNNATFGPDPAVNQLKRLRVNYEVNGVAGVKLVPENATINYPADLPQPLAVVLTAATYAAIDGSGSLDVLANLNARLQGGAFTLTVNNGAFGSDPSPNQVKRLRVAYTLDGKSFVKYIEEQKTFSFPADLTKPTAVPYLRKSFTLAKPVRKATVYATALGIYELSLNRQRVGDHILAPEWTDYSKRLRYQAYDVTSLLVAGENVLGAQLAHGWYSGHIGNGGYQYWGISPALFTQLELTYVDGSTERVVTDGSWKMERSPTTYSDYMMGEDYDARGEIPGWNAPGFNDSEWAGVLLRSEPPRLMNGQTMEPVRKLMEIAPKTLTQPQPGKWTYDLGQNMVGVLRLKITAAAGTRITLRHAEMLNPNGTVYTANLRGAPSVDTYICKGGDEESWTPKFTFHGFRYVELTGVASQPPLDAVTGIVFASDTAKSGEFNCSDGFINQLQSNIEWGQRGNYLSVPTDCPQRDERLGWLGDAQVFVRTATCNADIAAFFTKWMTDVTDSQRANGSYTDVAPFAGPSTGTPAWGDAGVICPWTIYQAYGDTRILEKNYDAMVAWVEWCRSNSTNSIRDRARGSDYGDWLSIGADTNKELIGTAYYAYSARLVSKAAAVLGHTADAVEYEALFQTIKAAFINKYVHPASGVMTGNTQCAYAMALKFDLLPASLRDEAVQLLENDVIAKGDHLSTGFVGVSYLLPALTEGGKADTAYRLLMQDTFPSWLFSVKLGATTIWERWDGWTPQNGFQSTVMNSFNHYSLGSCGEWLYGTVAGIDMDPSAVAYKKIIIRPKPGGSLTHASGKLKSIHGEIGCSWASHPGGFVLNAVIPANTTAVVHVPAASAASVMESGEPASEAEGVSFLHMESGAAVFAVESGRYRFSTGVAAPGTDTIFRDSGAPVKVRIATLLGNDGTGSPRFLSGGPLSVHGAAISVVDGWIHYLPPAGFSGADSFTYTVQDSQGGVATHTVNVTIIPANVPVQEAERIETRPDGSRRVLFLGVPGRIYRIQSSETMDGAEMWITRVNVQADEDGSFELIDLLPLPSARFYRAVFP